MISALARHNPKPLDYIAGLAPMDAEFQRFLRLRQSQIDARKREQETT